MPKLQAKSKLILALGLILGSTFVITSIVNYRVSRSAIRQEILTSSLPLTSENIFSQINADLLKPINVSSLMANDTFLRTWAENGERDLSKIVAYLQKIQNYYGYFSAFFVSATTRNYYYPGGVLKQISPDDEHDVWYYDCVKTGREYILDVDTNQAENDQWTIFINFRLEDEEGKLLGITGVGLEIDRVAKLLKQYQRVFNRKIYLVDKTGHIQAHSDKSLVANHAMVDWGTLMPSLDKMLVESEQSRQYQFDRGDNHLLLSIRYLPELDWYLVVEHDELASLRSARANMTRTLAVGLGASLIVVLLTFATLNKYQGKLETMASTDELTGVGNRREFDRQFAFAATRNARHDIDYSLILFDIDGLKAVNDQLGHLEGDRVIIAVSNLVVTNIRALDFVARWGGDEFIVLVEGGLEHAQTVAERIRAAVEAAQLPQHAAGGDRVPRVTVSCGVTEYDQEKSLDALTRRADEAMYQAKKQGKNSVVLI